MTSVSSVPATISDVVNLYTSSSVESGQLLLQTITSISSLPLTSTTSLGQEFSDITSYIAITTTVSPSPGSSQTSVPDDGGKDDQGKTLTITHHWTARQTFLGTYFGVLIAVIYRMLWTILYNNFTLIEPFRQLAHSNGAPADVSFFAFYQAQSNLFGPVPAFAKQRWTLALAGTAYLITSFLPAISSEALFVQTNYDCQFPDMRYPNNPCPARMIVSLPVLRVLQGLLAFTAIAILIILGIILARPTGLPSNPAASATVASMMRHPMLIADFNAIPTNANMAEMQKALKGKHYQLGVYKSAFGGQEYGIKPMHMQQEESEVDLDHKYTPVEGSGWYSDAANSRETARAWHYKDLTLAFVLVGTFGVVLAYYLDDRPDGFNNFFNSNTFGPRFILTGASTVVASLWRSVAHSQTVTAPYTRLAQGPSAPSSTILFTPSNTPILSTWQALRARYFSTAFLTIVALSAEALNIVISGVPYATGQVRTQLLVSVYLSFAVLALMLIAVVLLIFYLRRREPPMPRRPDTLGAVMSYMSGSRMLDDFEASEQESGSERRRRLQSLGKKYDFKEALRRDGKTGWMIDEVDHREYT
nr:hypothetical protein CFP56_22116 [Quercus suber]